MENEKGVSCFLKNVALITRIFGLLTIIVIWASVILLMQETKGRKYIEWYLLFLAIVLTLLESIWIIDKFACCRKEGLCCKCFKILVWLDDWKKGILLIIISVPAFLQHMLVLLGAVSGFFFVVLGILYILKTFRNNNIERRVETWSVSTSTWSLLPRLSDMGTQTLNTNNYESEEIVGESKTAE